LGEFFTLPNSYKDFNKTHETEKIEKIGRFNKIVEKEIEIKIGKKLKIKGINLKDISDVTGLSIEEIDKL